MNWVVYNKSFLRWFVFALLTCYSCFSYSLELELQRELYLKVERDLKRGQRASFVRAQNQLSSYPLYPYLIYQDLSKRMTRVKSETIIGMLEQYADTPIADKLRHRWLLHLAHRGSWELFAQHYDLSIYTTDDRMPCLYAQSFLHTENFDELWDLARGLWKVDFSQPAECDSIFEWGLEQGAIDQELIWQRILLVVNARKLKLADYLATKLSKEVRTWYTLLRRTYTNPLKLLIDIERYPSNSPFLHDVLLYGLRRAQTKDIHKTSVLWDNFKHRFRAYSQVYYSAERELGVSAAKQLEPHIALDYLRLLPANYSSLESSHWRVRSALRTRQWELLLETLNALATEEQQKSQWLYWKAHALYHIGRRSEALAIWHRVAKKPSYYGYLSADRIGTRYYLETPRTTISRGQLTEIERLPATQRAYEFFLLERFFDARREILYLLLQASTEARVKIALICRQWGWASGMIQALAHENFWSKELDLRFPMPHRELVEKEAHRAKVPQHWLYGVMRRESAFMEGVRSPAGALGLMQLMPLTANKVARQLHLRRPSSWDLLKPSLNIRLGAYYLQQVYHLNNKHLVLALASYNAGYYRVKQWLSRAIVYEPDIWVETIPFTETRRYVRSVLFYITIYQHKLQNKTDRLETIMPIH